MFPEELGGGFADYIRPLINKGYDLTEKRAIILGLKKHIENAVDKRASNKIGIAFSGGLDSSLISLICSKLNKKFTLLAVGLQNSEDLDYAQRIAIHYKWPLRIRLLSLSDAELVIKTVANMLKTDDVTQVGIGCVTYSVLSMAKQGNIKTVLGGLGAEEIFAGYKRHQDKHMKDPESVHDECWRGLTNLYEQDIKRDTSIASNFKIRLLAPFLDDELTRFTMRIDPKLKVSKDDRKIILKETALSLGLKKEFACRKKKAAQYGSLFHHAMEKLSKMNGFKYKREYLKSLLEASY